MPCVYIDCPILSRWVADCQVQVLDDGDVALVALSRISTYPGADHLRQRCVFLGGPRGQ